MKAGFNVADLQKAQKKLNTVETAEGKTDSKPSSSSADNKALGSLEELYEKHGGDLDLMYVIPANPLSLSLCFVTFLCFCDQGIKQRVGKQLKYYKPSNPNPDTLAHRFGELKCNPAKAKKPHHRPKDAKEFAEKYMQGYYSMVEDAIEQQEQATAADSKDHK